MTVITTTPPQTHTIYLLSVGRRGVDSRIADSFVLLSEDEAANLDVPREELDKRRHLYYLKAKGIAQPIGHVTEVQSRDPEGNSVFLGTAKFLDRWRDEAALAYWKSCDVAWQQWYEGKRALAKAKAANPLNDALAPVREAYRSLPNVQRAQLLAKIVAYITG